MPYTIDNKEVARVTEITGSGDCLATAEPSDTKIATTVTLAGTLVHLRIENYYRAMVGLPAEKLDWGIPSNLLWRKVIKLHKQQKKQNPDVVTSYETIMLKAKQCWHNFLDFHNDHAELQPVPDWIEGRVHSRMLDYAGTADFIAILPLKGKRVIRSHNIEGATSQFPDRDYFLECDRDQKKYEKDKRCKKFIGTGRTKKEAPACDCQYEQVVTLMDWKTSAQKQAGHKRQLSAYHSGVEEMGVFEQFRKVGEGQGGSGYAINWEVWSVLLGDHGLKTVTTPYRLIRYEPHINDFLVDCGTYATPRKISMDTRGKIGLKGRCMFCSHILDCPDRVLWSVDQKQPVFLNSLTHTEIKKGLLILEGQKKKGLNVDNLLSKFIEMSLIFGEFKADENLDKDILPDLTSFVGVPEDYVNFGNEIKTENND